MNALIIALVILWVLVFGLVVLRILELDTPLANHVNAFLDVIFPVSGGDQ